MGGGGSGEDEERNGGDDCFEWIMNGMRYEHRRIRVPVFFPYRSIVGETGTPFFHEPLHT